MCSSDRWLYRFTIASVLWPRTAASSAVVAPFIARYDAQLWRLNAATMGVPQSRERLFFVARRRDLGLPELAMEFGEPPITFRDATEALPFQDLQGTDIGKLGGMWSRVMPGERYSKLTNNERYFNWHKAAMTAPCPTIPGYAAVISHPSEKRKLSWVEVCLCSSWPYDYDFLDADVAKRCYVIGMGVPPVMAAQVAAQVAEQCFEVPAGQIDEGWT